MAVEALSDSAPSRHRPISADPGALDRGTAFVGPGFVQLIEPDEYGGKSLFEGDEAFGGGGHGGG